MLKKYLLIASLIIPSCSAGDNFAGSVVVQTAKEDVGLEERKDRYILSSMLGIDPVRTQWCAAYVNHILERNNLPTSETVSDHPLTARSFLSWGESVETPMLGDLVVFPRGNQGWQGHVGFYISTEEINGVTYYSILGGNQNDSVSYELYPASSAISIRRHNPN
jgi:uncharacterized protein (TIGR02594 family)